MKVVVLFLALTAFACSTSAPESTAQQSAAQREGGDPPSEPPSSDENECLFDNDCIKDHYCKPGRCFEGCPEGDYTCCEGNRCVPF